MASQGKIKECWNNAFESQGDYRVEVGSPAAAVALRAQCHKWRRSRALEFDPVDPERHYLYEIEIKLMADEDGRYFVVFTKAAPLVLPPPTGQKARILWCVLSQSGEFVIEQHSVPVTAAGFVSGHGSEIEAQAAIENLKALEAEMAGVTPVKKSVFTKEMLDEMK